VLVIDVGGSKVKLRVMPGGETFRFASGAKLSPGRMVRGVLEHVTCHDYDAVSIGYPGVVSAGLVTAEPHNLGRGWLGCDFAPAFGAPVRLINDAAMQAAGSYQGGRMLFLGLGTGLGATLIVEGVIAPLEIGHLAYRGGMSFEEHVGEQARRRLGSRKWRRVVHDVIDELAHSLCAEYVVIGGGNVKRLQELPEGAYRGDNENAFVGGALIWGGPDSLRLPPRPRAAVPAR
jgi:predicted NBD/HSP70 family sugar kinase